MTTDPNDTTKIEGYLARARAEYALTRTALAEALRNHDPALLGQLAAHSEELGVEATLVALRADPVGFKLSPAQTVPFAQLELLLPKLADLTWEIGALTGERENLAGRMTIADGRIFNVDGREATVDLASGTLRFLDQTTEPLNLELVDSHPTEKQPTKRRRRDRDR